MIKRYILAVNIVLILAAVYFGSMLFYKIFVQNKKDKPLLSVAETAAVIYKEKSVKPLSGYKFISDRNIFDTKNKSDSKSKKINVDSLKQTNLKIKLWGTVTGPIETAYAVIEDTGKKKQNLYKTGDTVQNATLKVILRNKVVLEVSGKDEILELEEAQTQKISKTPNKTLPTYPRKPERKSSMGQVRNRQKITLKRAYIKNSEQNILQLIEQDLIKWNFNNNEKTDGIALSNVRSSPILRQMRLRNGDIISKINGKKTNSIEDMIKLFNIINTSSDVDIQVKRRGKTINFKYNIK